MIGFFPEKYYISSKISNGAVLSGDCNQLSNTSKCCISSMSLCCNFNNFCNAFFQSLVVASDQSDQNIFRLLSGKPRHLQCPCYRSHAFIFAMPTMCQNTLMYQRCVLASILYKEINMSARSTSSIFPLYIDTILGQDAAFDALVFWHQRCNQRSLMLATTKFDASCTMLLFNHLTITKPELFSARESTAPFSCFFKPFTGINEKPCKRFALTVPTACKPILIR